jgi:hypothetical protein
MHSTRWLCHAGYVDSAGGPSDPARARLLTAGGLVGAAMVLGAATPALADTAAATPTAVDATGAATGAAPQIAPLCQVTDPRLPELSGLVVAGDRMVAMNDGGTELTVYVLDLGCQVVDVRTAPVDPYDPEDLALGADGTAWLADTGDNRLERPTVALLALRPDGTSGVYRLTYPDGPHDAESLLRAPDGTPYLVTKEVLGSSGVYRPAPPLIDGGTVALERVGTVNFTLTGTPGGPVGRAGQLMATGGAVSRDGTLIALRTYTDAYVWPMTGSDVAGALAGTPVRVALPEEPQGEAISFAPDDRQLVVSGEGSPADITLVPVSDETAPASPAGASPAGASPAADPSFLLRRPSLTTGLVAAAIATLVVWIGGRLRRLRRRSD